MLVFVQLLSDLFDERITQIERFARIVGWRTANRAFMTVASPTSTPAWEPSLSVAARP